MIYAIRSIVIVKPFAEVFDYISNPNNLPQWANAFSFTLTPPPVPLEELEGALEQQTVILEKELEKLKGILEK